MEQTASEPSAGRSPRRLRIWLIVVSVLTAVGIITALPAVLFGTYMSAFAADDPSASTDAVLGMMGTVWAAGLCYVLLLMAGLIGGWLAYRRGRYRLSFGLSWLAAGPILLVILAIVAVVVTSFVWTASIQGSPFFPQ